MTQTPDIGRMVRFRAAVATDRIDHRDMAAMITKVHSDTVVDLTVFPSGEKPFPLTSIEMAVPGASLGESIGRWFWPPRV